MKNYAIKESFGFSGDSIEIDGEICIDIRHIAVYRKEGDNVRLFIGGTDVYIVCNEKITTDEVFESIKKWKKKVSGVKETTIAKMDDKNPLKKFFK